MFPLGKAGRCDGRTAASDGYGVPAKKTDNVKRGIENL